MYGDDLYLGAKRGLTKRLAQHFLIDRVVLQNILLAADLDANDTVVEIGPGKGILTQQLVTFAGKVIAIEIDSRLASSLKDRLKSPKNLQVIEGDARTVTFDELFRDVQNYKLVANLPYYAAIPIIRRFLEYRDLKPDRIVCMVQKEVASTMTAAPGNRTVLSIAVQIFGAARIICDVSPSSFFPLPNVTSAVIQIDPFPAPMIDLDDLDNFFKLVKAGFSAPRKQLINALSIGLKVDTSLTSKLLKIAGIESDRRPGTLTIQEWKRLYKTAEGEKHVAG